MNRYLRIAAAALLVTTAAGCSAPKKSSYVIESKDNVITVEAKQVEAETEMDGEITVSEGEHVFVETALTAGKLTMNFVRGDEGDEVNPPVDYELTGEDTAEYVLDPHDYTVKFTVSEEASGTVKVYTGVPSYQEDGQNPIMNFVGRYGIERCTIEIAPAGTPGWAEATINWRTSAAEVSSWTMSGPFDPKTLTIAYDNCVKTDYVYGEDDKIQSEEVVYENGTGRITFDETVGLLLTWEDDQENIAAETVFAYVN